MKPTKQVGPGLSGEEVDAHKEKLFSVLCVKIDSLFGRQAGFVF
jgi:hypothetical protein